MRDLRNILHNKTNDAYQEKYVTGRGMRMQIPKLKKVSQSKDEEKEKVEKLIEDSLERPYIYSIPIEMLTISEFDLLTEYAKDNNIFISLKAEHSNFHQGTL